MDGASEKRAKGRPIRVEGGEHVRDALIRAAARLFAERGYDAVGIRELGREAGVTPGMIAYYFGDKLGLLQAVLDAVFERLLGELRTLAAAPLPQRSLPETLIGLYIDVLGRDPWIAQFLMREVLSRDGPIRERFIERFASQAARIAPLLFAEEIRSGRLRRDLDPILALLSLLGMCVFPFLAHPVMGPVLHFPLDAAFRERLKQHTIRLYLQGAGGANHAS
jgi:TetR/AcrR family transcriptional regulator